ncbi:hypothetical protein B4144_0530 [Bacillus atrophaeus]|nr:hypothetical protein B4144_0530 [Bacillus atrophaeus]
MTYFIMFPDGHIPKNTQTLFSAERNKYMKRRSGMNSKGRCLFKTHKKNSSMEGN